MIFSTGADTSQTFNIQSRCDRSPVDLGDKVHVTAKWRETKRKILGKFYVEYLNFIFQSKFRGSFSSCIFLISLFLIKTDHAIYFCSVSNTDFKRERRIDRSEFLFDVDVTNFWKRCFHCKVETVLLPAIFRDVLHNSRSAARSLQYRHTVVFIDCQ